MWNVWEKIRIRFGKSESGGDALEIQPKPTGILFCANYDPLTLRATQTLKEIANDLGLPWPTFKLVLSDKLNATYLIAEQGQLPEGGRLEIFCGHGIEGALLGPHVPGTPEIIRNDTSHSELYTKEMIPVGNAALLAICCSSASVLGAQFIYHPQNSFLGFRSFIPFYFGDADFMDKFQEILKATVINVLVSERLNIAHKNQMYDVYTRVIRYFKFGEGKSHKKNFEYALLFADHREKLTYMEYGQAV